MPKKWNRVSWAETWGFDFRSKYLCDVFYFIIYFLFLLYPAQVFRTQRTWKVFIEGWKDPTRGARKEKK